MRVSKILENENRGREATECIQSSNKKNLRYRIINEFTLSSDDVEYYQSVAKLLNGQLNDLVTFSLDDQDDDEHFIEVLNFIYDEFSQSTQTLPSVSGVNDEMIVRVNSWRIFIRHSSDDDIEISFIDRNINKFKEQLLDKHKK